TDERLRLADRPRSGEDQLLYAPVDRGVQVLLRNRGADEADFERAHGLKLLAGQEELTNGRLAELADDVRRNDGGDQAQPHLGETELRPERRYRDVRRGDEPGAAAHRRAVYARDHRLRRLVDREEHVGQRLRLAHVLVARERGPGAHPVEIGPGAERRP